MAVTILHATKAQHLEKIRESYAVLKGAQFTDLCALIQELIDLNDITQADLATVFGAGRAAAVKANILRVANSRAAIAGEAGE